MLDLNDFVMQKARPLPVIVAVDKSGSMSENGKIDALNGALKEFMNSLKNEDSPVDIQIALYSFGGSDAVCEMSLTSAGEINVDNFNFHASGGTPMGRAFTLIKETIENREIIPSRSYKPTIVLLTDGKPTDEYHNTLDALIHDGRSSKAFRIAMAIGDDADREMLAGFVSDPEFLVTGENARDIKKFFQFVTMSVTSRMHSQTPDTPPTVKYSEDQIVL